MNKFTLFTAVIISTLLIGACNQPATQGTSAPTAQQTNQGDEEKMMGLLYQQRAAEYRALCYQCYNNAKRTIDEAMKTNKKHDSLAVVTDLDETALDNSGEAVRLKCNYDSAEWKKWCDDAVADAVPGSVAFFNYADKKGIHIFYISNRNASELNATITNMKKLGFPQLTPDHFMMHTNTNSKDERRKEVEKKYKIALLLGDDLIDLHTCFDKTSTEERLRKTDSMMTEWGSHYIVLPNALYGDWENAMYTDYLKANPGTHLTNHIKDSLRANNLQKK